MSIYMKKLQARGATSFKVSVASEAKKNAPNLSCAACARNRTMLIAQTLGTEQRASCHFEFGDLNGKKFTSGARDRN